MVQTASVFHLKVAKVVAAFTGRSLTSDLMSMAKNSRSQRLSINSAQRISPIPGHAPGYFFIKKYQKVFKPYGTFFFTKFLKIFPLSSKFLNISKLALAGENKTISPFEAILLAKYTASSRLLQL